MKAVIAIDSFKGCLTSEQANQAAAQGVRDIFPDAHIHEVVVSDGGEGYLEAFHHAIGGQLVQVPVLDPLSRPITATYLLQGQLAVVEMAKASGLTLLTPQERNPMLTTSYGTGQLIADAVKHGAQHIIVGLGGSATSDAGQGMLQALIHNFSPSEHWTAMPQLEQVRFTMASDVKNPLYGPQGAAAVFAPQKGATPQMVEQLDARARQFAEDSARLLGHDCSQAEGAGAAGGLGYALLQYLHADSKSGIDLLLESIDFSQMVSDADIVITGEGAADRQTLMGKLPVGILHHAAPAPVYLIAGQVSDRQHLLQAGFAMAESINPPALSHQDAMRPEVARHNIRQTIARILTAH